MPERARSVARSGERPAACVDGREDGQLRVRLSHRPILMVASGSGLAPILSMLTDLVEKESQRAVRLFVGVRGADDLFALGQIDAIARALPAFEFVPVLSHDWPADWTGETGALNDAIARHVPSAHGGGRSSRWAPTSAASASASSRCSSS